MRPIIAATAALLIARGLSAQAPEPRLTRNQAVRDVRTLMDLLDTSHPDPFTRFGGKVEFRRHAQDLVAAIPDSGITSAELRDRLGTFLTRLHDGHTFIIGPTDKWRDPDGRLPVLFGIASDGLFVTAFGTEAMEGTLGWKLVAADGVPLDELLARFDAYPTENVYGGYAAAANLLRGFRYMNNLLGGLEPDGSITFTLERPDGRREERSIPWSARSTTPPAQWSQPPVNRPPWQATDGAAPGDLYATHLLDDPSVGYLRVGMLMSREAFEMSYHMNPENAQRDMERIWRFRGLEPPADVKSAIPAMPSLLETTVALLQKMKERGVPTLIIDLRGNDGGWTPSAYPMLQAIYGDAFFGNPWPGEYVTVESPLYLQKSNETVEQRRARDPGFEPGRYVFSNDPPAPDAEAARRKMIGEFQDAGYSFAAPMAALGGNAVYRPRRVVVLTDHGTYSAAFHLLMRLRSLGATVVGVPPRQSPNAFMEVTPFTLPESGLQGSISNSVQYMLPEKPDAMVLEPDFPVTLDVVRRFGADTEASLRYALELVRKGRIPDR